MTIEAGFGSGHYFLAEENPQRYLAGQYLLRCVADQVSETISEKGLAARNERPL